MPPSETCSDSAFIRRVSIDIGGRLPTPDEIRAFTNDNDPNKRDKLIDRLLDSSDYADNFATKWSALDGSTAELTLRQGVKFTDGTPFNAAAVKQAWDRAIAADQSIDPPSVRAMTSVDAVNDNTVMST